MRAGSAVAEEHEYRPTGEAHEDLRPGSVFSAVEQVTPGHHQPGVSPQVVMAIEWAHLGGD